MQELLRQKGEPKTGDREKTPAMGWGWVVPRKKRSNLAGPAALPIFRPSPPMLTREFEDYLVCPEGKSLLLAKHSPHLYLAEQDNSCQLLLLVKHMWQIAEIY